VLTTLPEVPCPSRLLDNDFRNVCRSPLLDEDLPNEAIKLSKLDCSDELFELDELLSEEDDELLNCDIKLCNLPSMSPPPIPIGGGGGLLSEVDFAETDDELVELFTSPWDCNAAIKVCMKADSADEGSVLEVFVETVASVEVLSVDEVDASTLPSIEVKPPDTPAALSAVSMAPRNPPPSLPCCESSGFRWWVPFPELTWEVWYILFVDDTLLILVIIMTPIWIYKLSCKERMTHLLQKEFNHGKLFSIILIKSAISSYLIESIVNLRKFM
jgi:hypothetical protein